MSDEAAVLEKLGYYYFYDVMPQYYDVILKNKYRRDSSDAASQVIDLIHDSIYTDFLFAYSPMVSQMGQVMRDLVTNNNVNYMSNVASKERAAAKSLERMYKELDKSRDP